MHTAQVFLAATSRASRPGESHRAGVDGLEAGGPRAEGPLRHHAADVFQRGERVAPLGGARRAALKIVLRLPRQSLQLQIAAGLQGCYRQDRGHVFLLLSSRPRPSEPFVRSRGHNQQQDGPRGRRARKRTKRGEKNWPTRLAGSPSNPEVEIGQAKRERPKEELAKQRREASADALNAK